MLTNIFYLIASRIPPGLFSLAGSRRKRAIDPSINQSMDLSIHRSIDLSIHRSIDVPGASWGLSGRPRGPSQRGPGTSQGLGKGLRRPSLGLPRPSGPSWGPSLEHGFSRGGFGGLMVADLAHPGGHFGVNFGPHFGRFSAQFWAFVDPFWKPFERQNE